MKKESILILVCMLMVFPVVNAQAQGITPELNKKFDNAGPNEKVEAIVVTNERPSQAQISNIKSEGANVSEKFEIVNAVTVSVPKQAAKAIANKPFVKRVEPNYNVSTVLDESSSKIKANQVWETNTTGEGIDVSIIDTGIDDNNENVQTELQRDFTGEGTDDLNGHGTHVAGIVSSDDSTYKGVAPGADLFDAKALNSDGSGTASDVISAIEWSVENDAEVISLSLGARVNSCDGNDILSEAVDQAVSQGTVAVVAAGNYGPESGTITIPGCSNRAITVGASDGSGNVADFSSRGPKADARVKPDVVAPGVRITSTWNDGSFKSLSGTSMATPHVSGVVALLLAENSGLTTTETKEIIISNATDLGFEPKTQGGGLVNALESYETIELNKTNETKNNETENNKTESNQTQEDTGENETRENVTGLPPGLANKTDLPPGLENRSTLPPGLRRKASAGPGSFAYGLDRAFESINLALTFNQTKKVQKRLDFAEERLAEAQVAAARDRLDRAQEAIENYEKTIEKAKETSEKSGNPKAEEMIENSRSKNSEALQKVYEKVPEQAKPSISEALNKTSGKGQSNKSGKNNTGESEKDDLPSQPERRNKNNSASQGKENADNGAKGSENSEGNSGQNQAGKEGSAGSSENANSNANSSDNKPDNAGSDNEGSSNPGSENSNGNSGSTSSPALTSSDSSGNSRSSNGGNGGGKDPSNNGNGFGPNGNSILNSFF
ncbi:MAG: S8 family serine peptidase [Candidatus Pacearchaeota archaeon]